MFSCNGMFFMNIEILSWSLWYFSFLFIGQYQRCYKLGEYFDKVCVICVSFQVCNGVCVLECVVVDFDWY